MKSIKSYVLIALMGVLGLTSCEDYFGDINVDPDNPTSVTPNVLLPQIQVRLAYTLGGDASRYIGIYTQHVDGVGRQFAVIQNYGIQPTDVNTMFGQNIYSGVLKDNRQLMDIAGEAGNNHYVGIGKAIEAYTMLLTTDLWGDVPYTEALQGTEVIQPKFDTQESIYNDVFGLIEEARQLLAGDGGGFTPGADDLFYGGDVSQWQKFLNVLEARARIHLVKMDSKNYELALEALNRGGFESSADDARLAFGSSATASAPWFQYIEQRDDIEVGATYVGIMQELNDPRIATYGHEHNVTDNPHPILTRTRATPVLTYTEAKFIEAEALLMTQGAAAAEEAYLEAVRSSFAEALVTDDYDDYITQESVVPADGISLEEVMTQKYIALFNDQEVFSDWRRTGIPALQPNTGSQVPRRLPYAQNEILSNLNTPSPAEVTIFSRVWWDE